MPVRARERDASRFRLRAGAIGAERAFGGGTRREPSFETGKADLPAVRIHDPRHSFAPLLVSGGMTLPMTGKLLGRTQVQTTQRYAHLLDDPLRAGLEQVGDMLRAKAGLVQAEAAA